MSSGLEQTVQMRQASRIKRLHVTLARYQPTKSAFGLRHLKLPIGRQIRTQGVTIAGINSVSQAASEDSEDVPSGSDSLDCT